MQIYCIIIHIIFQEPVSSSSSLGAQCVPPNVYHIGYGAKIKRSKSKQLENEFNQLIHSEKDEMQDMQVDSSAIISFIVGIIDTGFSWARVPHVIHATNGFTLNHLKIEGLRLKNLKSFFHFYLLQETVLPFL